MIKIEVEVSEATADAARKAGLLTPGFLEHLLQQEIARRHAADSLLSVAARVEAAGVPPMSLQEIDAEVKAYRAEQSRRAGRD